MKYPARISGFLVVILLFSACVPKPVTPTPVAGDVEPTSIHGTMDFTNAFINYIFEEHAVALVDMYGFVIRDEEWEILVSSQTLGFMDMNEESMHAEYFLQLPARPGGTFADVDNNGQDDMGVQIFAVSYWPNVYGGPYSEGDDRSLGWPGGFSSVKTDSENDDEVNGGVLVIWASDGRQSFPSGYGDDGLLFTGDDPAAPVQAGWTIVDLEQSPFAFTRESDPEITLYEPADYSVKDFSALSYTQAFDALVDFLKINYAFNGIEGKQPDYDALVADLRPRVEQAESAQDANAYYLALRDFTWAFMDGHVALSAGELQYQLFSEAISGGFGFAVRELDDSRFIVMYLLEDGPAEQAGFELGAELIAFNDQPVDEAVSAVRPWSLPMSQQSTIRYQQTRYLLRAQPDTQATVTFANPGGESQTVTLTAVAEWDSFSRTSIYYNAPTNLLPVEFRFLDSGVGYIAVYSEADDIQLTIRLFERALIAFADAEVPGIIIDMRYNGGGTPLGLAGFLTDQEIPLGQSYYFSESTGQFEPEGLLDKILPNGNQYRFDKIVILVGPACASACEQEAYGFSQVPGAMVVGMFPSSGIFAEVSRGQIEMPAGFSMQFPTGRYLTPEGELFLEGLGVQPNLLVPITPETVMTEDDIVLQVGERSVLEPLGAGISPTNPPTLVADQARAEEMLIGGADFLDEKAREVYESDQLEAVGTVTYTVALNRSTDHIWAYGWCASDDATLVQNLNQIRLSFVLNDQEVSPDLLHEFSYPAQGMSCRLVYAILTDWAPGEHHLSTTATFLTMINDGIAEYTPGDRIVEYNVYVKP